MWLEKLIKKLVRKMEANREGAVTEEEYKKDEVERLKVCDVR